MKHHLKTYAILLAIFLISFLSAKFIGGGELLRLLLASPGVLALLSALFQIMRDQAAFERQVELQANQMRFTLGAASHMANKAFDKHVEFCEIYLKNVHKIAVTLIRETDTPEAIDFANNLRQIRLDYAVWLTHKIDNGLEGFESQIRKLGANAQFIKTTMNSTSASHQDKTASMIRENHNLLLDILGIRDSGELKDQAIESVQKKVRMILGTEELTDLRDNLISEAAQFIRSRT